LLAVFSATHLLMMSATPSLSPLVQTRQHA